MLFPWVMTLKRDGALPDLKARLQSLVKTRLTPAEVVSGVPIELLRLHKYDEFLPETLLRERAVEEWVDWDEAQRALAHLAE